MSITYPDLPNTKFPEQVDDFPRMRDITASEVVLMEQYQTFIKAKDITSAQNLIESNPALKVVLFNAFNVNNVGDAVKALERFFDSNVNGYILQKQTEIQTFTDTKKAEILTYTDNEIADLVTFVNSKTAEMSLNQNNTINSIQTSKDSALIAIENKKDNIVAYMDGTTAGAIRNDLGILEDLTTTNKNSLVEAINEVNAKEVDLTSVNDKIAFLNGAGEAKEKANKSDLDTTNTNVTNLDTAVDSHTMQLSNITQDITEIHAMSKLYSYENIGGAL